MAYSKVVIPGDGVTTLVAVDFPLHYISKDHVTCRVGDEQDGAGNPLYRSFTFVQEGWAQVDGAPAAVGENYVFVRTVPKTQLIVDWEDNNPIIKENLNKAQLQSIQYTQELDDRITEMESADFQSQLDAEVAARIAGDTALSNRLDGYLGEIDAQADRAEAAANRSEAGAAESEYHAQVSHQLVEAAVAGFQGFTDGLAYDFGWVSDDMTYFNRDFGTIGD